MCSGNNLELNTKKRKDIIEDFRNVLFVPFDCFTVYLCVLSWPIICERAPKNNSNFDARKAASLRGAAVVLPVRRREAGLCEDDGSQRQEQGCVMTPVKQRSSSTVSGEARFGSADEYSTSLFDPCIMQKVLIKGYVRGRGDQRCYQGWFGTILCDAVALVYSVFVLLENELCSAFSVSRSDKTPDSTVL